MKAGSETRRGIRNGRRMSGHVHPCVLHLGGTHLPETTPTIEETIARPSTLHGVTIAPTIEAAIAPTIETTMAGTIEATIAPIISEATIALGIEADIVTTIEAAIAMKIETIIAPTIDLEAIIATMIEKIIATTIEKIIATTIGKIITPITEATIDRTDLRRSRRSGQEVDAQIYGRWRLFRCHRLQHPHFWMIQQKFLRRAKRQR